MSIHINKYHGTSGFNPEPKRFKDLHQYDVEVFVCENIQNIIDNSLDSNKPVVVHYEIDKLSIGDTQRLKNELKSDLFVEIEKSFSKSRSSDVRTLKKKVQKSIKRKQWTSLRIHEENTTGLNGSEDPDEDEKSPFNALMRAVNTTEKKESNTGGTWGKGSSVYTYCSGLWLWFGYSRLSEPWQSETGEVHNTRFMGRGLIAPYVDKKAKENFPGEYFYSREQDGLPFVNIEADNKAELFGLPVRNDSEYGTSYLIPDFQPDDIKSGEVVELITKFRQKVLEKWFIPVYEKKLIVRISTSSEDFESILIDDEYVKKVPQLSPYIELIDWKENGYVETPSLYHEFIKLDIPPLKNDFSEGKKFASKMSKNVKMDLAIKVFEKEEDYPDSWGIKNSVALSRNHGMIVSNYSDQVMDQLSKEYPYIAIFFGGLLSSNGPFESKQHADLFLAYSENPAHTVWGSSKNDLTRCHLDRFEDKGRKPYLRIKDFFDSVSNTFKNLFGEGEPRLESKEISSVWKKLAKIKSTGQSSSVNKSFKIEEVIERELPDKDKSYYWKLRLLSLESEKTIQIKAIPYLASNEKIIKSSDFETIGVADFANLIVIDQNGIEINELELGPGDEALVEIRTCKIHGRPEFIGLEPHIKLVDNYDNV